MLYVPSTEFGYPGPLVSNTPIYTTTVMIMVIIVKIGVLPSTEFGYPGPPPCDNVGKWAQRVTALASAYVPAQLFGFAQARRDEHAPRNCHLFRDFCCRA